MVPQLISSEVREHARSESPLECCGILAGTIDAECGWVMARFPIRNDLASPTEYLTNAQDLLHASRAIREAGLKELAIYHSHPTSEPIPSRTDLERNTWGETVVHLISGFGEIRSWWLLADRFEEIPVERNHDRNTPARSRGTRDFH